MNVWNMQDEKDVEEFKNNLMGLDDEFRFKCRKCGKCCTHQHTILFNTRDIFRIAQKLEITPMMVIEKYAETYIGDSTCIPVVRMVPCGKQEACPFLEEGRCSIHDCKPTVCAIYPLGRVIMGDTMEEISTAKVQYFIQNHSCGSQKQRHTVREWLGRFNIPENDEFFLLWTKVVSALSIPFRELRQKGIAEEPLNALWNIVYHELYLNYNLRKDFMPQFQASSERLIKLSQLAKELLVHLDTQPRLEV